MKILSRIRNKLLIAFAAVVTLPLVIVAIYGTRTTLTVLDRSALDAAANATQDAARRLDAILAAAQTDVLFLSQSLSLPMLASEPDPRAGGGLVLPRIKEQFRIFLQARSGYRRVVYADEEGRVALVLDAGSEAPTRVRSLEEGKSVRDRAFFREAAILLPGQAGVTFDPRTGEITYSARVFVQRYRSRGVVALSLVPDALLGSPEMTAEGAPTALLDREWRPIWSSVQEADRVPTVPEPSSVVGYGGAFHLAAGPIIAYARVSPTHGDPQSWVLLREIPETDLSGPVSSFRKVFTAVLIGALLLALVLSVALSRQLTGPLAELKAGARRMAEGDLGAELDVRSEDEIQELAGEFNKMARQLRDLTTGLERRVEEKVKERERLEVQLLQSERLSSIGLLAAGVAHEIRNPLATISMYAEMLLEKAEEGEPRKRLKVILEQIDRISQITRGLLDFSRQTDGEYGPIDLHGTLDATLRLVGPELVRQKVETEFERGPALPPVRGHQTQLQQAFLNIIMNSWQAMPDGGKLRVATRHLKGEGVAEVCVEDTGTGIREEDLGRVFDPFFTTKEPGEGTGLGLAVTYGIVQAHGGRIEMTSRPGEGTRVTIRLPLAEGEKG